MKKKTGGAHGKWKETFHIWNPRIKIGRKGQGCWQQNLLITTGLQRPHTYGTKLQQIIQREEKKTTTLAFSAVVRRSDMRASIGCTAISGHQLKHSTNNATTLGCVHSAAT